MEFKYTKYRPRGPEYMKVPPLVGVEPKRKTPWWKSALKVVGTLGICLLVGRESKLKPRDVVNGILIDLIYRKPITDPMAVLEIVRDRMIKAGLSKWDRKQQDGYAMERIRSQM